MKPLQAAIVMRAIDEIGVRESPRNSNRGDQVDLYKSATNLDPKQAWPWCAAFVCFIVRESLTKCGIKQTATFKRPTTAGAWDFIRWSKEQDNSTSTLVSPKAKDIQPGDVIVFKFSHIGIATSNANTMGEFQTCEGNTDENGSREGGGVYSKKRDIASVKARIRFNV
jgi:hypothetical protein